MVDVEALLAQMYIGTFTSVADIEAAIANDPAGIEPGHFAFSQEAYDAAVAAGAIVMVDGHPTFLGKPAVVIPPDVAPLA